MPCGSGQSFWTVVEQGRDSLPLLDKQRPSALEALAFNGFVLVLVL